jgi:hypothetical protein
MRIGAAGLFGAAAFLLIVYLFSEGSQTYLPSSVFWVAIALIACTITLQILGGELSSFAVKLILAEIAVTSLVLHLIYVVPYYGLNGSDPYGDLVSANTILKTGFILPNGFITSNVHGYDQYFLYPMIHNLGATLSMVSGIDLFSVAKWLPSFIDLLLTPLIYLWIKGIFKEEKIALLSAVLFAFLQNHISFSASFIRETLGLILAVSCIYLYFSARRSAQPAAKYILSFVCLAGTVFAHHLTSFLLIVFFLVHFMVTKLSDIKFLKKHYFKSELSVDRLTAKYLLVAAITLLAFWLFAANFTLEILVSIVKSVFTPAQYGEGSYVAATGMHSFSSIQTIRGNILYYGFYAFLAIFCLILLLRILPRKKNARVETYSFTLFLFLCLFIGFLSLYVIPGGAFPDRFLTYGWIFGFPPLVLAILKAKRKWFMRIGVLLLVSFMIFNVYLVDPSYWDAKNSQVTSVSPTLEDYTLAKTFNFSTGAIIGNAKTLLAIFELHNNLGTGLSYGEDVNLTNFHWVIINKPELELERTYYQNLTTIALLEQLTYGSVPNWNKIYESNNLVVVAFVGS